MKNKHLLLTIAVIFLAGSFCFAIPDKNPKSSADGNGKNVSSKIEQEGDWSFARKANQYTGKIDPADVIRAIEQVKALKLEKGGNGLGLNWDELGPNNFGGRTRAIVVDNENHNLMFAGSTGGGVWKSTTAGQSWEQVEGAVFDNLIVSCMVQASNGDIYFGTGEGLNDPDGSGLKGLNGQGIWKSTDHGTSFTQLESTWGNQSSKEAFVNVNALAIDPNNPSRVYASTLKGLRLSNDGGQTWTNPIADADTVSYDVEVAIDGTVIAAVGNTSYLSPNGDSGTFVSKSAVDGDTQGLINLEEVLRLDFAVSPDNADYMYCVAIKDDGSVRNIFQSKTKGETWEVIGPGGSSSFQPFSTSGKYSAAITVWPGNPAKFIIGGDNLWTWSEIGGWENITIGNDNEVGTHSGLYMHNKQHVIVFHPTEVGTIYVGHDGGISRSTDNGNSWHDLDLNYNVTQFYRVAFSGNGEVSGGSHGFGTVQLPGQGNDGNNQYGKIYRDGQPSAYRDYLNGGDCHYSMLNPKIGFLSTRSSKLHRIDFTDRVEWGFWNSGTGGAQITPVALWESWNDPLTWDTVNFIAEERDYNAGEKIMVESANAPGRYLEHTLDAYLPKGDTVEVHDTYTSILAWGLGGKPATKIKRWALNRRAEYDVLTWSVYHRDYFENDDYVIAIAISSDGNTIYSAYWDDDLEKYHIIRASNLINARDRATSDYTTYEYDKNLVSNQIIGTFDQVITSLAVDPNNNENLLVTCGNYGNDNFIYLSNNAESAADSLDNFVSKQGNLPQMPVYSGIFSWDNSNKVIVGTDYGVYSTSNFNVANPVWADENGNGLDNVAVYQVRMQYHENSESRGINNHGHIYLATFGRGLYKSETLKGPKSDDGAMSANPLVYNTEVAVYPNPVADHVNVSFDLNGRSQTEIQILDMTGKMVDNRILNVLEAGKHTVQVSTDQLASGTYFLKLKVNAEEITEKLIVR